MFDNCMLKLPQVGVNLVTLPSNDRVILKGWMSFVLGLDDIFLSEWNSRMPKAYSLNICKKASYSRPRSMFWISFKKSISILLSS